MGAGRRPASCLALREVAHTKNSRVLTQQCARLHARPWPCAGRGQPPQIARQVGAVSRRAAVGGLNVVAAGQLYFNTSLIHLAFGKLRQLGVGLLFLFEAFVQNFLVVTPV
jgi:hypothetical protein